MAPAEKLDLYKKYRKEYSASNMPALIEVKPALYLTVEGQGEPGGPAFQEALGALYAAAYTIKMTKKSAGRDYKVCGLEGLWWADTPGGDMAMESSAQWHWKLMIRTPDFIKDKDLASAVAAVHKKGKAAPVERVKLERIEEGECVQMLHVGPYSQEEQTITMMQVFAAANDLRFRGPHHEIYLSDPRRVPPERLKTILREPVAPNDEFVTLRERSGR